MGPFLEYHLRMGRKPEIAGAPDGPADVDNELQAWMATFA